MTMNRNGIFAGMKRRQRLPGNLKFIVISDKTGKFRGQHAVQINLHIFIVKNLQFDAGNIFRFQSEIPSQPDVVEYPTSYLEISLVSRQCRIRQLLLSMPKHQTQAQTNHRRVFRWCISSSTGQKTRQPK